MLPGAVFLAHCCELQSQPPAGVGHLWKAAVGVVGVIHGRAIRIGLLRQPVQLVVSEGNELFLPIDRVAGVLFSDVLKLPSDSSEPRKVN
jgi:hypothetical protein